MSPTFLAVFAYAWWGFVPLYWKQLSFPAAEIILYRILFSSLFLLPFMLAPPRQRLFLQLLRSRRIVSGLLLSGLLIGFNWYLYVWAVTSNRVVESSLGYFLNPLVNVALGTLLLGEKMKPAQQLACGFATAGVLLLTWSTGLFPWVAVLLACSVAFYGLVRKILQVSTIPGTFFETLLLVVPALGALLFLHEKGLAYSPPAQSQWGILLFSGLITTVPLLAFAEAAKSLPLTLLGFFQFLSPTFQFLLGVFVFKEPFGLLQWLSFSLIWMGLLLFLLSLRWRKARQLPA